MGFLRRLFRAKKSKDDHPNKRWSFLRSLNDNKSSSRITLPNATAQSSSLRGAELDPNKHAIAVAAATAAVAEAALAAARAAAEVVRLTSGRGRGGDGTGVGGRGSANGSSVPQRVGTTHAFEEDLAAIKIQSAFRGYLARRALRALKALVKLQALVRGHIVRKQMADMLRRMQTLVRLQAQARASRASTSASSHYSSSMSALSHHPRCGSNSNLRGSMNRDGMISGLNWLDRWMEESLWNNGRDAPPRNRHDDERSAKILEVDTWKPHLKSYGNHGTGSSHHQIGDSDYVNKSFTLIDSPSKYSSRVPNPVPSMSSEEVLSFRSLNFPRGKDEMNRSSESSPQVVSLSSRPGSSSAKRGPFTPSKSECLWGYFNGYPGHPNYMCNTESSRAKVRSQSAPRQRLDFDRYGPSTRALQESWDGGSNSELNYPVHYDLRSKTTASNRLTRNGSATSR